MSLAQGSGVWYQLGRTIAFSDRAAACAHFKLPQHVCKGWGIPLGRVFPEGRFELAALLGLRYAARAAGYDSVQYVSAPGFTSTTRSRTCATARAPRRARATSRRGRARLRIGAPWPSSRSGFRPTSLRRCAGAALRTCRTGVVLAVAVERGVARVVLHTNVAVIQDARDGRRVVRADQM